MIKLFKPFVSWRSGLYVLRTLYSGQLAEGPRVLEFEEKFGAKFKKKNVVAVNSGTSALELAYELAGIGKGDEVVVPVLTCTATNLPLVRRGAKIVFADIDYDLNISIEDVKNKITKKTKAVVFVHFGGNNRGLRELLALCRRRGIVLIEDAAQAVGSDYWGHADYTAVSLQAIKVLTSGDGGVLITKRRSDYEKARRLRWFGIDRPRKQKEGDVDVTEAGYKYHLGDVLGAVGLGNLEVIDKVIEKANNNASLYRELGVMGNTWVGSCLIYNKDYVQQKLKEAGYESGQHHFRNDKYSVFKKFKNKCPNMDILEDKFLLLPNHYFVNSSHIRDICAIIKEYGEEVQIKMSDVSKGIRGIR